MMHPVGPHAAQTYWIRRALVAIVAVALVVGVVWWALGRASGPGSGPGSLAATTSDTTAPKLTGVLATNLSTDSPLESTTESEMQFEEPDLSAADVSDAAESGSTTGAAAAAASATAKGETQAGTGADGAKTTASGTGAASTTAAGTSVAAKTTKAASPSTAPTGPRVVETTVPAPVTVTVTKLVPATATAAKTTASKPTTTAPPKPSYDSAGRLICPAASISLTGVVWGTVAGQQPRLGMNVTNVGKQACRQDVSGAKQVYTVYSAGGDRVWSTADCFPGEGTEVRTLGVGQKASFVIVWSGTTSEPGCTAPREKVKAGKYTLVVQLGPLKSKPLAFTMH